ncbi:MAG: hypothetical protein E7323_04710 [Clostridiales bacterium]|nr:hypothetical protein [Clostridiales bacterium]
MAKETLDIVIAGLGSQPLAFACFVLARMAQNKGLDVHILEPEDTACKAVAHVRIAKKADRKPIAQGEADVLVGLEPIDAIKALPYLKKTGIALINGPDDLSNERLSSAFPDVEKPLSLLEGYQIEHRDTLTLSRKLGSPMALVTALLGMLSKHLPFTAYDWQHAIGSSVPRKTLAVNLDAFLEGRGDTADEPESGKRSLLDQSETKKDDECFETTM